MKKPNRIKGMEMLLLLLPVVLLVASGVVLRQRRVPPPTKTTLFVKEIIYKGGPKAVDFWARARVEISVGYRGAEPFWWKSKFNRWVPNISFVTKHGNVYKVRPYLPMGSWYVPEQQHFVLDYMCEFVKVRQVPEKGVFQGTLAVKDVSNPNSNLAVVHFSTKVTAQRD